MDLIGDIVEKKIEPPGEFEVQQLKELKINKKPSKWKQRLERKKIESRSDNAAPVQKQYENEASELESKKELTEKEKVHLENLKYFASMSSSQLMEEKKELMETIDPKILKALMKKMEKGDKYLNEESQEQAKPKSHNKTSSEVSTKSSKKENVSKSVRFVEPPKSDLKPKEQQSQTLESQFPTETEFSEPVPTSEKLLAADNTPRSELLEGVHFVKNPKPTSEDDINIDLEDPEFLDKLHSKYFPDLPKNVDQLSWMQPVEPFDNKEQILEPSDIRFDFSGNIMIPDPEFIKKIPTSSGLYHHSENPQLPGYTLKELSELCWSKFNSQRCIAIRTIGRILYKLGKHKYEIMDENGMSSEEDSSLKSDFEKKMWELVEKYNVIDALTYSSDEKATSSLSVRSYAVDALWLWKEGKN